MSLSADRFLASGKTKMKCRKELLASVAVRNEMYFKMVFDKYVLWLISTRCFFKETLPGFRCQRSRIVLLINVFERQNK